MNSASPQPLSSPGRQNRVDGPGRTSEGRGALPFRRRLPVGAEPADDGTHFRVWAPHADTVSVELLDGSGRRASLHALAREAGGYHAAFIPAARTGARYRFVLPQGAFPDPASRFQPEGPHGPSEIVEPRFAWNDHGWRGRAPDELVIYELHLGTFTHEGTWRAAEQELPELARLGITAIEIMPVADFTGRHGWGYDGVDLYAPTRLYGPPADARSFINRAHALGLSVLLDVVYNHLGPDGCYLREFAPDYFSTRYKNEWGEPLNFDGDLSGPVREFFIANARYWIEEFHFDGLRLDATQQIFDSSPVHLVAEIAAAVRTAGAGRRTLLVAENEPQQAALLRPSSSGGYGLDAVWNDDFHHCALVAATGHTEAYYGDYRGHAQEFVSACKRGFLYQGQLSRWQRKRRGTPALDLGPDRFVTFLQNHDQVANSLRGARLHQLASPGMLRALTALHLLSPSIPLLFQGQEFAASSPFLYFADHDPGLSAQVVAGRSRFIRQFRSVASREADAFLPDCAAPESFLQCKLNLAERRRHRPVYQLHEDLLRLRRDQTIFRKPAALDGAVLAERAFVLRFFGPPGGDRLLVVNLGGDLDCNPAPEPLLAPLVDGGWTVTWSSESPVYGGGGTPDLETSESWIIPGPAAFVLSPTTHRELPRAVLSEKH